MNIELTNDSGKSGEFHLTGEQNCYWLPDSGAVARNCVFLGDHVVLYGHFGGLLSSSDEDGLLRLVLDGSTIGSYYASRDRVTGVWSIEVDITYLLKDLAEQMSSWGLNVCGAPTEKTYTPRTIVLYSENTDTVVCSADIVILEGHSLDKMVHPIYEEASTSVVEVRSLRDMYARVQPPNVMLKFGNGNDTLTFGDVWFECGDSWEYISAPNTTSNILEDFKSCTNGNGGTVCIDTTDVGYIYYSGKQGKYRTGFSYIGQDLCKEYAVVRWKSCTGNWRQHIFEVRNITNNLDSSTITDPIGTEYRTLTEDSYQFDIYLSGLTKYSMWYYQDILTSKEIYCTILGGGSGENYALFTQDMVNSHPDKSYSCSVVNPKKFAVPNGNSNKFYDFSCTLKYKKCGI